MGQFYFGTLGQFSIGVDRAAGVQSVGICHSVQVRRRSGLKSRAVRQMAKSREAFPLTARRVMGVTLLPIARPAVPS